MSKSQPIPRPLFPFQLPTRVVLTGAEGNVAPVRSLLDGAIKSETAADWDAALQSLQQDAAQLSEYKGHLVASDPAYGDHWQTGDRQLNFRPPSIGFLRSVARRQDTIAVVIVAASLDDQSAIAFCRSIADFSVRVLWVTETISPFAITLLNERTAHAVLLADDPDIAAKLPSLVEQLTAEYFDRLTAPLQPLLNTGATQFFADPAARRLVCQTRRALSAEEYYVTSEPPGVMMIGKAGLAFLLISDGEYLRAQQEIGAELPAHTDLSASPHSAGFYEESTSFSWHNFAWNSAPLEGAPQWSTALVHERFDNSHLFDGVLGRNNKA